MKSWCCSRIQLWSHTCHEFCQCPLQKRSQVHPLISTSTAITLLSGNIILGQDHRQSLLKSVSILQVEWFEGIHVTPLASFKLSSGFLRHGGITVYNLPMFPRPWYIFSPAPLSPASVAPFHSSKSPGPFSLQCLPFSKASACLLVFCLQKVWPLFSKP